VPELGQLRTFVAVAEEANFTRAAQRLYIGQQAASKSKAVRQLERELGVQLLERSTREVRLTGAGAALLEGGRAALAAVDASFQRARAVGHGLAGTVTVGATPAIPPAERDRIAETLRNGADDLVVALRDVRPREIFRQLHDRTLDLVLARTRVDGVAAAPLTPSPAALCVPEGHPLGTAGSVPAAELDGARLLTWNPPGTPYTDLLTSSLAAAGATVTPVQARVTGGVLASELNEANAVAVLPADWPPTESIIQLALDDGLTLPLLILWAADASPPAVTRLRGYTDRPAWVCQVSGVTGSC
jgi:DNA-binding transcriptional LysR family regulator